MSSIVSLIVLPHLGYEEQGSSYLCGCSCLATSLVPTDGHSKTKGDVQRYFKLGWWIISDQLCFEDSKLFKEAH